MSKTTFKLTKISPNGQKSSLKISSSRYKTVRGYMQWQREQIKTLLNFQAGDSITCEIFEPEPQEKQTFTRSEVETLLFQLAEHYGGTSSKQDIEEFNEWMEFNF